MTILLEAGWLHSRTGLVAKRREPDRKSQCDRSCDDEVENREGDNDRQTASHAGINRFFILCFGMARLGSANDR